MRRPGPLRSEEHTSELQSLRHLVCRLLLEKKKTHLFQDHRHTKQKTKNTPHEQALLTDRMCYCGFEILRGTEPCGPIFFFNDTATTEIYTLSLHDALPI